MGSLGVIHGGSVSQVGPTIKGRSTIITMFEPAQFAQSAFLMSMQNVANSAFSAGHVNAGVLPAHILRVPNQQYLINELGDAPGTFTYIIHENNEDVIATATMRPFSVIPIVEDPSMTEEMLDKIRRNKSFTRSEGLPPDVQGWELKMMFVSHDAQRQGLADLLMRLCEAEAKRRTAADTESKAKELLFMLTCIEEINGPFYKKKGFKEDAKAFQPIGTFESTTGFTVLHMSKSMSTA